MYVVRRMTACVSFDHISLLLRPARGRDSLVSFGGDVVAVVIIQVEGAAVHLKLAVTSILNCVLCHSQSIPLPLELQGAGDRQSPGWPQSKPSQDDPASAAGFI